MLPNQAPVAERKMPYWSRSDAEAWLASRNGEKIKGRKYFCIGLGKTGTTTFKACAERYELSHFGSGCVEIFRTKDFDGLCRIIESHDSFDDYPWPLLFEWLDVVCEDAKFALTLRSTPEIWLESLKKHYAVTGPTLAKFVHFGYYSPFENEKWHLDCYVDHVSLVRDYFEGDRRLTEFDWSCETGWDRIAAFFDRQPRDGALPQSNRRRQSVDDLDVRKRLADAKLAHMQGSRSAGLCSYFRILSENRDHGPSWFQCAEILKGMGMASEGLYFTHQARRKSPDNKRYRRAMNGFNYETLIAQRDIGTNNFSEKVAAYFDGSDKTFNLTLLLNAKFLPGLLSLLASLMQAGSMRGATITVMTDDPAVADFPFVRRVAGRVVFFDDDTLSLFQGISRQNVKRGERHNRLAKYTLLKFFFFEAPEEEYRVFLDCDMVVRRPIEEVLELGSGFRFFAARELPHDNKIFTGINAARRGAVTADAGIFNSGFMIASREFLAEDPAPVTSLIEIAEHEEFRKEQVIASTYLQGRAGTAELPCFWNFLRSYAQRLEPEQYDSIKDDIAVAHYVTRKPWQREGWEITDFDQIWLGSVDEAERSYGDAWLQTLAAALIGAASFVKPA